MITIIAILAAMLFPTFGKMQRKAQQNNSINLSKQHVGSVIGYFTDARKRYLPAFGDAVGTLTEAMALCPAGGGSRAVTESNDYHSGDFSYVRGSNTGQATGTLWQLPSDHDLVLSGHKTTEWLAGGQNTKWLTLNNDQSPLVCNEHNFTQTQSLKGIGYGDGHAGIAGSE